MVFPHKGVCISHGNVGSWLVLIGLRATLNYDMYDYKDNHRLYDGIDINYITYLNFMSVWYGFVVICEI